MSDLKTQHNQQSVRQFPNAIEDDRKRKESKTICSIPRKVTERHNALLH